MYRWFKYGIKENFKKLWFEKRLGRIEEVRRK